MFKSFVYFTILNLLFAFFIINVDSQSVEQKHAEKDQLNTIDPLLEKSKKFNEWINNLIQQAKNKSALVYKPIFPENKCTNYQGLKGICVSKLACYQRKGEADKSKCGIGKVCCVSLLKCGMENAHSRSYFVSEDVAKPGVCEVTIKRETENICYLLVKFEKFDIIEPKDGLCQDDIFSVDGADLNFKVPNLCGENSGHHIFIPNKLSDNGIKLSFNLSDQVYQRKWKLRITQISCDDENAPPFGCLKYYSKEKGTIMSFNYGGKEGYLNDLNYAMCFKHRKNFCGLKIFFNKFSLAGKYPFCDGKDFIQIPPVCERNMPARYCGCLTKEKIEIQLNNNINNVLYFKSNSKGPNPMGFLMKYEHTLCNN